ncbi:MAG: DJ-1 family glyoxalase III [Myxococcota bacterium]
MSRKPTALVLVAQGTEEMEAVITIDVLRRGGIDVTVAGLDGAVPTRCSRSVVIVPDVSVDDIDGDYDVIVLPGGAEGAKRLAGSKRVGELLKAQEKSDRWVAAICAAPVALHTHQVFEGRRMTSHPSVKPTLDEWATYSQSSVVQDGNLVTSRGPGTAFAFALRLVGILTDAETMAEVRAPMMFPVQVS